MGENAKTRSMREMASVDWHTSEKTNADISTGCMLVITDNVKKISLALQTLLAREDNYKAMYEHERKEAARLRRKIERLENKLKTFQ